MKAQEHEKERKRDDKDDAQAWLGLGRSAWDVVNELKRYHNVDFFLETLASGDQVRWGTLLNRQVLRWSLGHSRCLELVAALLAHQQFDPNGMCLGILPALHVLCLDTPPAVNELLRLFVNCTRVNVLLRDGAGHTPLHRLVWIQAFDLAHFFIDLCEGSGRDPGPLLSSDFHTTPSMASLVSAWILRRATETTKLLARVSRLRADIASAALLCDVVLVSDGFLRLPPSSPASSPSSSSSSSLTSSSSSLSFPTVSTMMAGEAESGMRFFRVVSRLPLELQMLICAVAPTTDGDQSVAERSAGNPNINSRRFTRALLLRAQYLSISYES